jgi:hypothetical protein
VAFPWPSTVALEKEGLSDAYRVLFPDVVAQPGKRASVHNETHIAGITWSSINKYYQQWGYTIPRMLDRIDMIHYKSPILKPIKFTTFTNYELLYS